MENVCFLHKWVEDTDEKIRQKEMRNMLQKWVEDTNEKIR